MVLLLGSAVGILACIILQNKHIFPLSPITLVFFSFVALLLALYRPGWTFLLLVASVPLEAINLLPASFGGVMLRPYQWLTVILFLAVAIRFVSGRLPFRLFRPQWFDVLPISIALGAFLALFEAPLLALAFKQALVVTSFVGIYFLGRIFFRTVFDVLQALPFFLVSSMVVAGYALWQNMSFVAGRENFAVMAGRPNATFAEPDWLGLFALLMLGVAYALLYRSCFSSKGQSIKTVLRKPQAWLAFLFTVLTSVILIITVARSAWLGVGVLAGVFVGGCLFERGLPLFRASWRRAGIMATLIVLSGLLAGGVVGLFSLSPFQFGNRIQSTGSGLQKITVSCDSADTALPWKVTLLDLERNGCRHIPLEAIEAEKQAGHAIREVYRDDPNVAIRKGIYKTAMTLLEEHPLLGIGWGSAAVFLGTDERGAGLNASNIFLEVWLGSGLLGLVALVVWGGLIIYTTSRWFWETDEVTEKIFALFLLATLLGMTVFDLFNSGVLLGFVFLFLSLTTLSLERHIAMWRAKKETL